MIRCIKNCDLCGSSVENNSMELASSLFDQYGIKSDIHILMCKHCKYIFQQEEFSPDMLDKLYKQDNGYDPSLDIKQTDIFLRNKSKRQKVITSAIDLAGLAGEESLNVLDVGGGIGEITEHLADKNKVYLADLNSSEPIRPEIIKINKSFEEIDLVKKFDVIVMNHVLEHTYSPSKFLEKAHELLTDKGIIVIEVPFELYTPMLFKRTGDWRHVAYFSTKVLKNFLNKTGFKALKLKLSTSHYHLRTITVIRAIAQKEELGQEQLNNKSSYYNLIWDSLNPKALLHYMKSQIKKISK